MIVYKIPEFCINLFPTLLLEIRSTNFIFLKTFNSEFSYIEVRFIDQNCNPLEIEDLT